MSRIKPYKAKRRIADYQALEDARRIAVDSYRAGLMDYFDRRRPREPIRWNPGPGCVRNFQVLMGQIEKAQYTAMIYDDSSSHSKLRSVFMIEQAGRGAALEIAKYLMNEGFIKESKEHVPGLGHRLTFTFYAAKVRA